MRADSIQVIRQGEGLECAFGEVPASLRGYLLSWCGYSEHTSTSLLRRELPVSSIVVIIELGPSLKVYDPGSERAWQRYPGGFVAGLGEHFTLTEHEGFQTGMELRLTPLGARCLFDVPLKELTEQVVHIAELLPKAHRCLTEQLTASRSWPERFTILESTLLALMARGRPPCKKTSWALAQIQARAGNIEIAALTRELGCSRKHLAALFHDGVGFTPKAYANIVRFERLVEHLKEQGVSSWASVAGQFGYADQAHLAREVKRFSGLTPRALLNALPVTMVQDQGWAAE